MQIKIQSRQSGKTYDIAQRMKKEESSAVIVPSLMQGDYFAKAFKIDKKRIFCFSEIIRNPEQLRGFKDVYIDEIGGCIQIIIPNVRYATHT